VKKFAANYILSITGELLKNGILIANDKGKVMEQKDTKGYLEEIAQLTFLNGILIPGIRFIELNSGQTNYFTLNDWIEKAKQIQEKSPEMHIPDIVRMIASTLSVHYRMEPDEGIFLLTGVDLVQLHLTPQSQLKKII
jgi:hypothetical protein